MNYSNSGNTFINLLNQYHSATALIWEEQSFTYAQILEKIDYWQIRLNKINPGDIVILESDFSPQTIALLLVLIAKNAIVVPLDKNHKLKNAEKVSIAQPDYLISVVDENQVEITEVKDGSVKNDLYLAIQKQLAPGLVLFTSGSSGKPKGALHNFAKLLAKFEIKRKHP